MTKQTYPFIIVSGPTATGKTSTSVALANHFENIEIINFDSLCFYKELSIGTAKPTLEERKSIPHHLIDIASIKEPLNASDFVKQAHDKINELHQKGKIPLLVGGSAFYIRALVKGMYDDNNSSDENQLEALYKEQGIDPIIHYLKTHDPISLERIHHNDHYRLVRAACFFQENQRSISLEKKNFDDELPYDFNHGLKHPWDIFHIYLDLEKEEHWKIIHQRTEEMIENGLIDEVHNLLNLDFSPSLKPLKSIGYKETIAYLQEESPSKDKLIESIYISTRQLAKAQRTFFKKITPKSTYNPLENRQDIVNDVKQFLSYNKFI